MPGTFFYFFIQELKSLFASIPYHIFIGDRDAYYHSIIYWLLSLNGAAVKAEDPTNIGRINAVLETGKGKGERKRNKTNDQKE